MKWRNTQMKIKVDYLNSKVSDITKAIKEISEGVKEINSYTAWSDSFKRENINKLVTQRKQLIKDNFEEMNNHLVSTVKQVKQGEPITNYQERLSMVNLKTS